MAGPRIVVLDGHTLNPGDLSWEPLAALGSLRVFDRTPPESVGPRAADAPIILTNKTPIDAAALATLPALRYIGVLATGTNVVDGAEARARGIVVTNVPSYAADSVAEHTLGLMLEGVKHLTSHVNAVRGGAWAAQPDFSFTVQPVRVLSGKTLGLVGYGSIGKRVAELALAFKMSVVVARRRPTTTGDAAMGVSFVELDEVFRTADIVSLHCPLTPSTEHLVDARRIELMKPGALLVNTARGKLVDEAALAAALKEGRLGGAYLDVLGSEPPEERHALISSGRCSVTPHIAWASVEARSRLLEIATHNVRSFLAGAPVNVV